MRSRRVQPREAHHQYPPTSYSIRPADSSDHDRIIDGFCSAKQPWASESWLQWKFLDQPERLAPPLFVAEDGNQIIGAAGFQGYRLSSGNAPIFAVQPTDVFVEQADDNSSLLAAMLIKGITAWEEAGAAIAIGFGPESTMDYLEAAGWGQVTAREVFVRFQRPAGVFRSYSGRVLDPLMRGGIDVLSYCRRAILELSRTIDPVPRDVVSLDPTHLSILERLYLDSLPLSRLHLIRDSRYLSWRFSTPSITYRLYITACHGSPTVGLVTGTTERDGRTLTAIIDALPLKRDETSSRSLESALTVALSEHAQSDIVLAPGGLLSDDQLGAWGFLGTHRLPLSVWYDRTIQLVYPLDTTGHASIKREHLFDPNAWEFTHLFTDPWRMY